MTQGPQPDAPAAELEAWLAQRLLPLRATGAPASGGLHPAGERDAQRVVWSAAAVLVGLIARSGELNVILTRRADHLRHHSGQIAFPGGRIEPGETALQAALREAREEIGLDSAHVRPLGLADVHATVTGFQVTPVVAFVAPQAEFVAHEDEVAEVFETPFAWLMDSANYAQGSRLVDGVARPFDVIAHGERRIWGATAGMLRDLRERVFGEAAVMG